MSATSHFEPSSGFHPVYKTCVPLDEKYADCSLHLLYTFPPDVLVDPYELENYKSSYTFNIAAVPDLELPVFAADPQNLSLFVNVVPPQESSTQVCIELPIHLRYGRPSNSTSHEYLEIPCPFTYLICGDETRHVYDSECRSSLEVPVGNKGQSREVHIITAAVILLVFYHCLERAIVTYRRLQARSRTKVQ